MDETDTHPGMADRKDELRYLNARLKLVVGSLSANIIFNPVMACVAAAVFVIAPDAFGHLTAGRIIAAIAIQLVSASVSWIVYRTNRTEPLDLARLRRKLVATQIFYAVCWSAVGWLFWQNGNAVNNAFIALVLLSVVWAATFTRAAYTPVFVAGTLTLAVLYMLRFVTAPGIVAHVMAGLTPITLVYILMMGAGARRRVDELLRVQFSNEDLTEALRIARDDALIKRHEAEAANASKTAFLANMSHELRTPLNAILGFSDIIADETFGPANPRYPEYARDVHNSGVHLLSLINDLLDVAKIEAGKMELDPRPLDPAVVLESVERLMTPRAQSKNQTLELVLDADRPWIEADARALKQIAFNLVSNAVKFTPDGGHITVTGRAADEGGFMLTVEDDGPGIEADKLDGIFQPFSQVDNRYDRQGGGTGLGLSLVQGLVKLHGGRVWLESEVDVGTKAFVYFPLAIEHPQSAVHAAE